MLTTLIKYRENPKSEGLKSLVSEVMDRTANFIYLVDSHPCFQSVLTSLSSGVSLL